jgi:hypothetical protein
MRVVGSAGYLHDRARKRGSRALFLFITGIVVVAASFIAAQSPGTNALLSGFPAFIGFGAILLGVLQASAARRDADAAGAEGPLLAQLRARLSDDYLYLHRVTLPGQNAEAEAVLLGPHGALVLGVHGAPGTYTVRGDDWYEARTDQNRSAAPAAPESAASRAGPGEALRESPSWRLTRPLRALQRIVREEGFIELPVNGAVVLARGELTGAERPSVAVVPVSRIASYVEYLKAEDPEALREPVQQLAEMLTPLAAGGRAARGSKGADGNAPA